MKLILNEYEVKEAIIRYLNAKNLHQGCSRCHILIDVTGDKVAVEVELIKEDDE